MSQSGRRSPQIQMCETVWTLPVVERWRGPCLCLSVASVSGALDSAALKAWTEIAEAFASRAGGWTIV